MNYHIVRMNETIDKIALNYNLSVDEIKQINKHIRNWNIITPGIKLNLPAIPENLKDDLNDIEPFIEDYYPRYNSEILDDDLEEENINNEVSLLNESVESNENAKSTKQVKNNHYPKMPFYYGYYPPYPMYYPYYNYYNRMRKK